VAARRRPRKRESSLAWLGTLVVGVVLITGGFGAGVLLGVVTEEPSVLTSAWAGGGERVALSPEAVGDRAGEIGTAPAATPSPFQTRIAAVPPRPQPIPENDAPGIRVGDLPAVSASPSNFAVQVGAFASSESARAMKAKLDGGGYESFVSPGAASRDRRWRVRVGPFSTRSQAEQAAVRLERRDGLSTWIVRLADEG